jgi:hypothetical protein
VSAAKDTVTAKDQLAIRTARKDGRQVVTMRSVARKNEFVVECEVYPVSGLRVDPLNPGPYAFPTAADADAFLEEATRALTTLGCEVKS